MASSCLLNFARYPPQGHQGPQGGPRPQGGSHPQGSPPVSPGPVDVIAEDDDDDEVLSVGSEPRVPGSSPGSPAGSPRSEDPDECCDNVPCVPTIGALKFSIANILRPEFGSARSSGARTAGPTRPVPIVSPPGGPSGGPPAPIDLSRVSSNPVQPPPPPPSVASVASSTSSTSSSSTENGSSSDPLLWPAWVYCTRYSDRPSSGESKFLCALNNNHASTRVGDTQSRKEFGLVYFNMVSV